MNKKIRPLMLAIFLVLPVFWVKAQPQLLWRQDFSALVQDTAGLKDFAVTPGREPQFPLAAVLVKDGLVILDNAGKPADKIPLADYQKISLAKDAPAFCYLKTGEIILSDYKGVVLAKITLDSRPLLGQNSLLEISPNAGWLIFAPYFGRQACLYNSQGEKLAGYDLGDLKGSRAKFSSDGKFCLLHLPAVGQNAIGGRLVMFSADGKKIWEFSHPGNDADFDISHDGSRVILAAQDKLYILDRQGKVSQEIKLIAGGNNIAISGNGAYTVLSRVFDHSLSLIDNGSGRQIWMKTVDGFDPQASPINSLAISHDAQFAAIAISKDYTLKNRETTVYLFDQSGEAAGRLDFQTRAVSLEFSPKADILSAQGDKEVYLYQVERVN